MTTAKPKTLLTYNQIKQRIIDLRLDQKARYYGVPRGGTYVSLLMDNPVENAMLADYIIDDIEESGATRRKWERLYPHKKFITLYSKKDFNSWVTFPWEQCLTGDNEGIEDNVRRILQYFDPDPTREGLKETPQRVQKFYKEITAPVDFKMSVFDSEGYDQMITQSGIPFYSLCEHHLLPFAGEAVISYLPKGHIVGLSKLSRTVDKFSRGFQNQERITNSVADYIMEAVNPHGVGVSLKARHLCMEMRGVKKHNTYTTTTALRGSFLKEPNVKQEFMRNL